MESHQAVNLSRNRIHTLQTTITDTDSPYAPRETQCNRSSYRCFSHEIQKDHRITIRVIKSKSSGLRLRVSKISRSSELDDEVLVNKFKNIRSNTTMKERDCSNGTPAIASTEQNKINCKINKIDTSTKERNCLNGTPTWTDRSKQQNPGGEAPRLRDILASE